VNWKKVGLAVGATGAVALLAGCYGPATGHVVNTVNYVATYDKQFQIDAGYPIIFITYTCHGETLPKHTPGINVNEYPAGDLTIAAYCATGFANAFPDDSHS
jgi:hypothetical protein